MYVYIYDIHINSRRYTISICFIFIKQMYIECLNFECELNEEIKYSKNKKKSVIYMCMHIFASKMDITKFVYEGATLVPIAVPKMCMNCSALNSKLLILSANSNNLCKISLLGLESCALLSPRNSSMRDKPKSDHI